MKPLHLLLCLTTMNHICFVGARLAVLIYAAYLGASPVVVGLLASLFALFAIVTSLAVGRWIDRIGPRTPLIIASVGMILGSALAFFWREVAVLFIVSTVVGTLHNVFQIAQQQMVGRYGRPEERAANFSLSSLANSGATFLGPMIAGVGIDHLGHPVTFLVLAGFALVPLPFIAFKALTYPPVPPRRAAGVREPSSRGMWGLLRDSSLRRIYIASVLTNGTWSVVNFLVPLYGLQIGLDATRIGTLVGTFAVATVLVRLVLTLIVGRFGAWQLMAAALFVTGTAFAALPMTSSFPLLLAISFWLGMGLGVSGPMTQALLYDASPPERVGEVIGLRITMQNVCQAGVPLLSGAIGTAMGVAPVFWVLSAMILWGFYDNRDRLKRPPRD
jgi:MFS family permease